VGVWCIVQLSYPDCWWWQWCDGRGGGCRSCARLSLVAGGDIVLSNTALPLHENVLINTPTTLHVFVLLNCFCCACAAWCPCAGAPPIPPPQLLSRIAELAARRQMGYQGGARGAGIPAGRLNSDGGMATAYDVSGWVGVLWEQGM
jgi:hypothetical protein